MTSDELITKSKSKPKKEKKIVAEQSTKRHRSRVKERYLKIGGDKFEDYEILEMILFFCILRKDTKDIAKALIDKFGSFSKVLDASMKDLTKFSGITLNGFFLLNLMKETSRRYINDKAKNFENEVYDTIDKIGEYFENKFLGYTEEACFIMFLDSSMKIINCTQVPVGNTSEVLVDTRKVIELVITNKASVIAIAHNHPSGSHEPSISDIEITNILKKDLKIINADLKEHIIVNNGGYIALIREGYVSD